MDDDVKQALDDLRADLKELGRTRAGSGERRRAEADVRESREDLEDVLRREGYRLSRRELDRLVDEDEDRRFNERLDRRLAELKAAEEDDGDEDDEEVEGEDGKPKPKRKPAAKKTEPAKDEEEEWT